MFFSNFFGLNGVHRTAKLTTSASILLVITACSTHPVTEDVTRINTVQIVDRIRCEVKAGLKNFPHDPLLRNTAIGYDFEFTITENNDAKGGKVELKSLFAGGTLGLTFGAGAEKQRENKRELRIVEHLDDIEKLNCDNVEKPAANYLYPMTGRIGMDELVNTYLQIESRTNFREIEFNKIKGVVFSDTLTFTTMLSAGLSPTFKLEGLSSSLKVTDATIGTTVMRKDTHKVVVALIHSPQPQLTKFVRTTKGESKVRIASGMAFYAATNGQISKTLIPIIQRRSSSSDGVLIELERLRLRRERLESPRIIDLQLAPQ